MSRRLVVLLSGRGSNLGALIEHVHRDPGVAAEIVGVVSSRRDAAGLEMAAAANLITRSVDHRDFPDRESFENALTGAIVPLAPDRLILAGFMRILSDSFVNRFSPSILNVHPSLLPDFRGLDTHRRALERGDACAGASVHVVTPDLDAGPVIARVRVPIRKADSPDTLARRVLAAEHLLFPEVLKWDAAGRLVLERDQVMLDDRPLPATGIDLRVDREELVPC